MDHHVRNELKAKGSVQISQFWCGRSVKVVDGTSSSMPDTPENQELYPQPKGQKKGCGFPVMKLVVSFCLTTGILLSCRKGNLNIHERIVWHQMWDDYEEGDVVLADRGFCAFADYWLLGQRGVDCVMRLHQRRKEKKIIKRFNKNDRLIQWNKNNKIPNWITRQQWDKIPTKMTVRHINVSVVIPGFRTKNFVLATTLLDEKKYPPEAVAALYRRRWKVELFFRDIKTTMKMEILRCKTPNMIHKELTIFIIAYNLIRILIWEAALMHDVDAFRISVAGTIKIIRQWGTMLAHVEDKNKRAVLICKMMEFIAHDIVPERDRKRQPRALKRRMKPFQLLTKPRNEFMEIEHREKYRKDLGSS